MILKRGGDSGGTGLIEVLLNTVAVILDLCLGADISLHGVLHGFWDSRRTGTDSLESKLIQQLMATREEFLYEIFLYLHKAYNTLDRDMCHKIL